MNIGNDTTFCNIKKSEHFFKKTFLNSMTTLGWHASAHWVPRGTGVTLIFAPTL